MSLWIIWNDKSVPSNAASLFLVFFHNKLHIWPQDHKLRTCLHRLNFRFWISLCFRGNKSFKRNSINTAEKICSSKMLLHLLGKSQIWLKLLKIKEKDKTTERMWEGKLALCRWQNSVPFRTCHRILRTVFSSRPLGHFSSSSRTVWSTNSKTRYSLFFLRNTSIRFTRWSCRSCCNTMEKLCTSFYSTCVKILKFPSIKIV